MTSLIEGSPGAELMVALGEALFTAQKLMPDLQKNAINPHFGSSYISLDSLMEQVLPVLHEHGVLLTQAPTSLGYESVIPALRTRFTHIATGQFLEDTMPLLLDKQNAQGLGSALTYARRYALMAWLGLVADVDDDANAASKGGKNEVVRKENGNGAAGPSGSPF